jgi:pyruvate formate-lyase activating enzyme-like uncharacterized protein
LKEELNEGFMLRSEIDERKLRILISKKMAEKLSKTISTELFKIALVEEYPTFDEFIVELKMLN